MKLQVVYIGESLHNGYLGEPGRERMRLYWFRGTVHNILLLYFIAAGLG